MNWTFPERKIKPPNFVLIYDSIPFQFLTKLHLMDYSMLVGIHDMAQAEEEALLNENANRDAAAGRETSESEECESGEKYVVSYQSKPYNQSLIFFILYFFFV